MVRMLAGCVVVGALLGAPLPGTAQERSLGFTYAPSLSLHDEGACCSAAGAWLAIGRLHVEHVIAWDSKWREYPTAAKVDGHALTALWTLRYWRAQRFRTLFQVGGRHGTAVEPTPRAWGFGAGLTVDYIAGPAVLRGAVRMLLPKPPELRVGFGFRF